MAVSADMAILEGNLLGEGGARKAAGCGLGTRFLAGEKCCCRVENAGLLSCCDSAFAGREVGSCTDSRVGGGKVVDAFKIVDDLVRA